VGQLDAGALVTSALERLGVVHSVMACDPAAADTAVFCPAELLKVRGLHVVPGLAQPR
jgi:hypothetical protein